MAGVVFTSDWHLSSRTWAHRPRLVGDTDFSLWQIVSFCLKHQAAMIAAGDLFDKDRPDPAAVGSLIRAMDAMRAAGLPVYYIQGQHERTDNPWLGIHEHPIHVDGKLFQIPGFQQDFYGLDWTPATQIVERLTSVPGSVEFLVCHQVWLEHMGLLCNPECDVQFVPRHVRYVLTGDYHQHQIIEPRPGLKMVSPGSISIRNLGEPENKSFWYLPVDGAEFQSVPLCTRVVIRHTISNEAQLAAFVTDLELARAGMRRGDVRILDGEPICAVKFMNELPNAYQRISQVAGEAHLFIEEIKQTTVELLEPGLVAPTEDVTLAGCLREVLPQESDLGPAIVSLLASTKPPMVAVQELVASWG